MKVQTKDHFLYSLTSLGKYPGDIADCPQHILPQQPLAAVCPPHGEGPALSTIRIIKWAFVF